VDPLVCEAVRALMPWHPVNIDALATHLALSASQLRGEQPPSLYAEDGGDCYYAPDAGRAIALLATAEVLRHNTYNVSSGRMFTNRDLADALQAITPGLHLDLLPGRQNGPGADPYLDITGLTQDTGFTPAFDSTTAVGDYVAWRAHNPR
jgi:nucleoside-diphosphate-sugar epimerase